MIVSKNGAGARLLAPLLKIIIIIFYIYCLPLLKIIINMGVGFVLLFVVIFSASSPRSSRSFLRFILADPLSASQSMESLS
jgi:hypothetical protein